MLQIIVSTLCSTQEEAANMQMKEDYEIKMVTCTSVFYNLEIFKRMYLVIMRFCLTNMADQSISPDNHVRVTFVMFFSPIIMSDISSNPHVK